jgi:hypothetical protein
MKKIQSDIRNPHATRNSNPDGLGIQKGVRRKPLLCQTFFPKELRAQVSILNNGKRKKVPMLVAIVKQHLNKAANGDSKAAAMVLNHLKENKPGVGDNLSELVQEFRALHNRHRAADGERSESGNTENKVEEQE